ncbi:MAG: DUF5011 domain-containing protein, partial [Candidatus Izemoplasmatales bacterium]|nr:DUF5011 domain-containing protein [Candidatus Izemoplasmatales bacterium]
MKKVLWATIFCFMMLVLVACQTTTSANLTTQAPVTTTTSATTPTTSSATTLAPTTLAPTTLPPTTTITTTIPTTTATTTVATTDTAPVISGADDITIERNSPFIPLAGVSAYDAEDGNLTSRISYSGIVNPNAVGVYTATYTVVDNDGNVTTVNRKVTVVFTDRVAPLITGVGAKTIYVGDVFNPQTGVSANDTVDGSVAVSVSGAVNVWLPGTYQLTYSATDQAGNTATQIRTITVTFGDFVFGEEETIEESAFIVGGASITSPAISGGKINAAIANFSYVMVTIQARAAVNKDVAIMLSGSVASSHAVLPVTTSVQTFTVYFKIDSALVDQVFTLTPDGVELLDFDFSYSFAEIRDLIAPVLNVPRPDAGYKVGGTQAQLEAILRSGVTAVDDIDGNITSSIVLDFSAVNFNEVGIYDVIYTATDKGGNQASYTRKVTIGNLVDAGYLTDPHFQNNGDGKWSHKSSDGVASIAYNPTEGTMIVTVSSLGNWLSAAGAVSKLNSNGLEVDQWYLFTFTVKTTINRTMGFRMGLMSNQANNWIDDFDGRSDYLFAINNEYQTFSFYFKLNTLVSTSGAEEFIIELNLGNLNYSNIGKDGVTTFKDVAMYKVVTNFEAPTVEAVVGQNLPTKFVVGANQPVWANYVVFKDMSGLVLTPSVDVSALDMNVAGNYVVRYSVTDSHDLTTTYDLNVQVVEAQNADTTGPVITVKSGVPTTLDQFTNIQVNLTQLVDVEDAIDGIITVYPSMVQNGGLNFNVAGVYTVTYTVFDKSGNVTILAVDVTILDKQAPTISVGDFAISVGDSFDGLQGVSIIDNVDGAIALSALTIDGLAQFVANGKVFVTGVFNVTYTVADASGNVASKTIKVSVTDIIFDEDSRTPLGTPDEGPTHSSATYDAVEGATLITNINPNTQSWDHARWVYYLGAGTDLIFGKTYKFELTVKAAQATDIYFRVGATLWVDPWIDNFTGGVQSIAVTTEYITYSIIFTVDKEMVNGNAKFQFMYGYLPSDATNTIYIKNFDLLMQQEPIVNNIYDLLKLPAEQSDSVATFENNVLTISNIMNSGSARIVNYFDWNKALFALGETYRFE